MVETSRSSETGSLFCHRARQMQPPMGASKAARVHRCRGFRCILQRPGALIAVADYHYTGRVNHALPLVSGTDARRVSPFLPIPSRWALASKRRSIGNSSHPFVILLTTTSKRDPNAASHGRLKSSHFEERNIRLLPSTALPAQREVRHGECTQDGTQRSNSILTSAWLVAAADRSGAGH